MVLLDCEYSKRTECCGNHSPAAPGVPLIPTVPWNHLLHSNTSFVLGTPGGRMTSSLAQRTSMLGGHWDTQRCSQLSSFSWQPAVNIFNKHDPNDASFWQEIWQTPKPFQGWCLSLCWKRLHKARVTAAQGAPGRAAEGSPSPLSAFWSFFFFVCPGNPVRQRELGVQTDRQCERFSASFRSNYSVISSNLHIKLDEKHRLISACGS